mgnify:CR=1 FL=1
MTEAQARNALDMAGFGVDVSYQENDSVTEGTVISWNPSGKQKPGATITVVIAKKSGKATVPGTCTVRAFPPLLPRSTTPVSITLASVTRTAIP